MIVLANGKQKWVSEIIGDDYKKWKDEFIVLDCGTGTGKTFFCTNILGRFAQSQNKRILYLCNRSKLRTDVYEKVKQLKLTDVIDVTSYQSLQQQIQDDRQIPKYDYIISDECHYFTSDAAFNNYTDVSYKYIMQQEQSVVIFISATAKKFFKYLLDTGKVDKRNNYRLDKDYSYVNKVYYYQKDELVGIIDDILENETDSKIVVFCNAGKRIIDMNKIYRDKAQYYCSKSTKDSRLRELCGWNDETAEQCIKSYADNLITFQKRILFTTSVLDNGVDLKDEHIKHIFTEIIDIDVMVQSLGRKRSLNKNDTCTFYIREYQDKGVHGFLENIKRELNPVELYLKDYQKFFEEYGHGKKRNKLKNNTIFYFNFNEKKDAGQAAINQCRYQKYKQDFVTFSSMKEMGHICFLESILEKQLVDKSEYIVADVKLIDTFMEFLKSYEDRPLYRSDRDKVIEEFKTTIAIKLDARNVGINTLNGQLEDVYGSFYPCRFYNRDVNGKMYIDKKRKLENGNENPNRDKTYWILEDRSILG